MADRERPWSKFYWSDFESDNALRQCSLAAQGLWMRLLCICARSETRGYLTIAGVDLDVAAIATAVSKPETEVSLLLAELERWAVFSRDRKGRIYSRRMVRDEKRVRTNTKNGKNGGNPALFKRAVICGKQKENSGSDNPPLKGSVKAQIPESRSQIEDSPSSAPPLAEPPTATASPSPDDGKHTHDRSAKRGSRLSADWNPDGDCWDFAEQLGLDPASIAEQFRDYWRAVPGAKGLKLDWSATWRMWCRREGERRQKPGGGRSGRSIDFDEQIRGNRRATINAIAGELDPGRVVAGWPDRGGVGRGRGVC